MYAYRDVINRVLLLLQVRLLHVSFIVCQPASKFRNQNLAVFDVRTYSSCVWLHSTKGPTLREREKRSGQFVVDLLLEGEEGGPA